MYKFFEPEEGLLFDGWATKPTLLGTRQTGWLTLTTEKLVFSYKPYDTDILKEEILLPHIKRVKRSKKLLLPDVFILKITAHSGVYSYVVEKADGPEWLEIIKSACFVSKSWDNYTTKNDHPPM